MFVLKISGVEISYQAYEVLQDIRRVRVIFVRKQSWIPMLLFLFDLIGKQWKHKVLL